MFCRVIRTYSAAAVKQLVLHSCNQPTNSFAAGVVMTSASGAVYEKQRIDSAALHRIYLAAASGRSQVLPCFAAFLALVRFSGLFAFTQFFSDPEYHVRPGESDSG